MALAIWIGASVEHVHFNLWLLGGLAGGTVLTAILRLARRGSIIDLRGTAVFALWLATRFLVTPAFFLLGLAWIVCAAFGLAAAGALLNALILTTVYVGAAIFATSILADLSAAIKGPRRDSPSDS
jgi:hypothetical protein